MSNRDDDVTDPETATDEVDEKKFKEMCEGDITAKIKNEDEIAKCYGKNSERSSKKDGFGDDGAFGKFDNDNASLFQNCIENRTKIYKDYDQVFIEKEAEDEGINQDNYKENMLLYQLFNEDNGPAEKVFFDFCDYLKTIEDVDEKYEEIMGSITAEFEEAEKIKESEPAAESVDAETAPDSDSEADSESNKIKKILDKIKIDNESDSDKKANEFCKMVFCFAWEYTENDKSKGGAPGEEVEIIEETAMQKFRKKMFHKMVFVFAIMGIVFYSFILLDTARLFIYATNHIMDMKQLYVGDDNFNTIFGENTLMNYIIGFTITFSQIVSGSIIQKLQTYQDTALTRIQQGFATAAHDTSRTVVANCMENMATCVNGLFTGMFTSASVGTLSDNLEHERQKAIVDATAALKGNFRDLTNKVGYATTGLVTGVNGLLTCSLIIGNMVDPEKYTKSHVGQSVSILTGSYAISPLSMTAFGVTSTNIALLFRPESFTFNYVETPSSTSSSGSDAANTLEDLSKEQGEIQTSTTLTLTENGDNAGGGKKKISKSRKFFSKLAKKQSTRKRKRKSKKKAKKRKSRRKTMKRRRKK
tara:strand:- start:1790 stop:3553 length:1764 start_codon:yes stop_codon:yes gene_type:complete